MALVTLEEGALISALENTDNLPNESLPYCKLFRKIDVRLTNDRPSEQVIDILYNLLMEPNPETISYISGLYFIMLELHKTDLDSEEGRELMDRVYKIIPEEIIGILPVNKRANNDLLQNLLTA